MSEHETKGTGDPRGERELRERLAAHVLGELSEGESRALEAELAGSDELRGARERLAATAALVRSACAESETLSAAARAALVRAADSPPPSIAWYRRPSWRVAAGYLVVAGAAAWAASALWSEGVGDDAGRRDATVARGDRKNENGGLDRLRGLGYLGDEEVPSSAPQSGLSDRLKDIGYSSEGSTIEGDPASTGLESVLSASTGAVELQVPLEQSREALRIAGAKTATRSSEGDVRRALGESPAGISRIDLNGFGSDAGDPQFEAGEVFLAGAGEDVRGRHEGIYGMPAQDAAVLNATDALSSSTDAPSSGSSLDGQATGAGEVAAKSTGVAAAPPAGGGGGGGGGHTYRGPGDSVPPPKSVDLSGSDDFYLGHRSRRGGESPDAKKRARRPNAPSTGGGGPSSPGPSGPSTPAPGRAAPGSRSTPSSPPAAGRVALGGGSGGAVRGVDLPAEGRPSDSGEIGVDELVDFDLEARAGLRLRYLALSPAEQAVLLDRRVTRVLQSCRRRPGERPRDMFFRFWGDNPFVWARLDPQSTFSVDVDTASYVLARRYLTDGYLPEKAQIRTEEFLNYFKPDVPAPTEGTFALHTDLTPTPYGNPAGDRWTMRVVVRGKEVSREERRPMALTFVVDVSGSMKEENRLELVKHGLRLLVSQLDARDSIGLVVFSNEARVVLPQTSAANRGLIETALYGLSPNGGTNAEAGLMMGYELALAGLSAQHTNRVVLLSDGVANIGQTDQDRINGAVTRHREQGIFLNTIGVGMDNHNDVFLEQLADKGDGICNYIDGQLEARRALVDNFTGAFEPIARDVKIQVEFDPAAVARYRLLGYENRAIADQDFRNDAIDAGEVGAGHQVVALYQLELANPAPEGPIAIVRLRWKPPTGVGRDPLEDAATETNQPVQFGSATAWEGASAGFQRAVIVGQFAEILRRSIHAREVSLDELIASAQRLSPALGDPDFDELIALMQKSRTLVLQNRPQPTDYERCVDLLRHNHIRRVECEHLPVDRRSAIVSQLEEENRRLEQQIRDLLRQEMERDDGPSGR